MLKTVAPKTASGKRVFDKKQPQVIEGPKPTLFVKGTTTSETVTAALTELCAFKKPDAVMLSKRNDIHPFDDVKPLEFLSQKNDAGIIVFGSHSKKRPNNLVFVRTFDYQLLDMVELGIDGMMSMHEFESLKASVGSRPVVLFNGEAWDLSQEMTTLKSIFLDFFANDPTSDKVNLSGLETLVSLTAVMLLSGEFQVWLRMYRIVLKKVPGSKIPKSLMEDMGPHIDFTLRRSTLAESTTMKEALKVPKELKNAATIKKGKNVETNDFGETVGRIWLDKQDLSKLQTRKMKGLKKRKRNDDGDEENDLEAEMAVMNE